MEARSAALPSRDQRPWNFCGWGRALWLHQKSRLRSGRRLYLRTNDSSAPCASQRARRTRGERYGNLIPMLHDLKDRKLFPMLSQNDISVLKSYGQIVEAEDGQLLQEEGNKDRALWLVLAGRLRVFRRV